MRPKNSKDKVKEVEPEEIQAKNKGKEDKLSLVHEDQPRIPYPARLKIIELND